MLTVLKSNTSPNPFHKLLAGLSDTEYQVVTLDYLKEVSEIVNEYSVLVKTFGEAFQVLEFLRDAKAVDLVSVEDSEGVYKIKKRK